MTKLSEHFTLLEMIRSDTGTRLNIDNTPTPEHLANLVLVCVHILEPVRKVFGAVRVNSGYRSLALNMAINPLTTTLTRLSKHCTGQAADFEVDGIPNATIADWCTKNLPDWDQIILEFYTPGQPNSGWVHAGYQKDKNRKEVLTAVRENGKTLYKVGLIA